MKHWIPFLLGLCLTLSAGCRASSPVSTPPVPAPTPTLILPTPPPWPTAPPPPTVMLPDGSVATSLPVTPPPFYATQEANRRATVVARATASPFSSAQPATVQAGNPSLATTRRTAHQSKPV